MEKFIWTKINSAQKGVSTNNRITTCHLRLLTHVIHIRLQTIMMRKWSLVDFLSVPTPEYLFSRVFVFMGYMKLHRSKVKLVRNYSPMTRQLVAFRMRRLPLSGPFTTPNCVCYSNHNNVRVVWLKSPKLGYLSGIFAYLSEQSTFMDDV